MKTPGRTPIGSLLSFNWGELYLQIKKQAEEMLGGEIPNESAAVHFIEFIVSRKLADSSVVCLTFAPAFDGSQTKKGQLGLMAGDDESIVCRIYSDLSTAKCNELAKWAIGKVLDRLQLS